MVASKRGVTSHAGKRAGLGRPRPIGYSRRKPSARAFSAEIVTRPVPVCPMILPLPQTGIGV